jgi:hypothetical protein
MLVLYGAVSTNVLKDHKAFIFVIKLLDHDDTGTMLLKNIRIHVLNVAQDLSVRSVNCRCVRRIMLFQKFPV